MIGPLFTVTVLLALLTIVFPKGRRFFGALAGTGLITVVVVILNEAPADTNRAAPQAAEQQSNTPMVNVRFRSDPDGATVHIDGRSVGTTPHTEPLEQGEAVRYNLRAEEPYDEYDLYKPYSATLTPEEDVALDVWLNRTTAEEQQAQRERHAQARAEAEERRLQSELRGSPWRLVRRTDEITDEDSSHVITYATDTPSILEDDAYLMIRCDVSDPTASDGISIILNADDYLGRHDLPLDWRFDDNAAVQRQQWRASTNGTALFNLSYKTMFLTQMFEAERLTVRLYDYRNVTSNYAFDVDGARAALTLLGCYRGGAL